MGAEARPEILLEVDYSYLFEMWRQAADGKPVIEVIAAEAKRGGRFAQCALGEMLLYGRDTQKIYHMQFVG